MGTSTQCRLISERFVALIDYIICEESQRFRIRFLLESVVVTVWSVSLTLFSHT